MNKETNNSNDCLVKVSPFREWMIITLILGLFAAIVFYGGMQFAQAAEARIQVGSAIAANR